MLRILALITLLGAVAGCGLLPEEIDDTKNWSASKLYATAKESLNEGDYEKSVKLYEKLEARYPYGAYAQQAQLEVAYAYYRASEPISAVAACERFIKLYPQHPNVDYAYYLKGLANFVEDQSFLAQLGEQDMSERDPKAAREAFEAFKELANRFPESKYTPDAVARMKYLVNALAAHEVHVGRYYYKRGAYVAAANRGKYVLQNYQQSPALEEALVIMARSYEKLGLKDLREDTMRVIKKNFPDSPYLTGKDYNKSRPWWRFWELKSLD
jgi:outer membrane protein assembly factor BamD